MYKFRNGIGEGESFLIKPSAIIEFRSFRPDRVLIPQQPRSSLSLEQRHLANQLNIFSLFLVFLSYGFSPISKYARGLTDTVSTLLVKANPYIQANVTIVTLAQTCPIVWTKFASSNPFADKLRRMPTCEVQHAAIPIAAKTETRPNEIRSGAVSRNSVSAFLEKLFSRVPQALQKGSKARRFLPRESALCKLVQTSSTSLAGRCQEVLKHRLTTLFEGGPFRAIPLQDEQPRLAGAIVKPSRRVVRRGEAAHRLTSPLVNCLIWLCSKAEIRQEAAPIDLYAFSKTNQSCDNNTLFNKGYYHDPSINKSLEYKLSKPNNSAIKISKSSIPDVDDIRNLIRNKAFNRNIYRAISVPINNPITNSSIFGEYSDVTIVTSVNLRTIWGEDLGNVTIVT